MTANGRSNGRLSRPELPREQPIRGFSTLFGAGSEEPKRARRPSKKAPSAPAARPPNIDAGPSVARSVESGYRVIEEYLKRGQAAAQGAGSAAKGAGKQSDPSRLTERMFQYASDFASVWLELMQTLLLANPAIQQAQGASAGPFTTERAPGTAGAATPPAAASAAPAVPRSAAVHVDSPLPVEVSWEIFPAEPLGELLVHALHGSDASATPLTDVRVEQPANSASPLIRLRVPSAQPPGTYSGLIVNGKTNMPAGTLLVVVRAPT